MICCASSFPSGVAAGDSDAWAQAAQRAALRAGGPLLALDTSSAQCSVALVLPGQAYEAAPPGGPQASAGLVTSIAALLAAAGISPRELRALVVGLGPGSFTGLRVGLATAKGLALAADLPLYGVSSLALWAAAAAPLASGASPTPVAVALDARGGAVFAGLYEVSAACAQPCWPDVSMAASELAAALRRHPSCAGLHLVGDAAGDLAQRLLASGAPPPQLAAASPRALAAVALAATDLAAARPLALAGLVPRYLRLSAPERLLQGR